MLLPYLPQEIIAIAKEVAANKGKALLVGGSVRDHFLDLASHKDLDVEVYGLSPAELETVLSQFGKISAVGKHFGVFKLSLNQCEYDFSLPRTENKIGKGHKGFMVTPAPDISFKEAASRRDFTINAIGYDILSGEIHDPFNGLQNLQQKIIKHIGPAFVEDPLRVLRAIQFAGRFEFSIAEETIEICQSIDLEELPKERIFEEFKKLLLRSKRPSLGLQAAQTMGILKYFPELEALIGVPQDPKWHPEGDVWTHTLMVIDEAAKLRTDENEKADLCLMFGALCHDFGKPLTTEFIHNRWRSPAHDVKGLEPTETFLRRLTDDYKIIDLVKIYVKEHLKPAALYNARHEVKDGAIRRLATKVSIPDLVQVAQADHFGRTTPDALAREFPAGQWLLEQAEALQVKQEAPSPILKGRHLLDLGMQPGPMMGKLIQECFELQLDGQMESLDEMIFWAKEKLKNLPLLSPEGMTQSKELNY